MVRAQGYRIAFENLDIKRLTYSDLAAIKEQLRKSLRAVQNEMADREMCPKYDAEIEAWKMDGVKESAWYNES
jgi:hypothetical protein